MSGCADALVESEDEAIDFAKRYFAFMPANASQLPPRDPTSSPSVNTETLQEVVIPDESKPFDMGRVINAIIDQGKFLEIKARFAGGIVTAFARVDGRPIGIIANQPMHLGGVLFVDSADKAARFIWLCDAFNIPLLFLADVPGFMIGSKVERPGIIGSGAKMIAAVSEASVPKLAISGRSERRMVRACTQCAGPPSSPWRVWRYRRRASPSSAPPAAVNAVFYNKLQEVPEGEVRDALVAQLREEYRRRYRYP